jgi:anti-anti-sigma factor
MVMLTVSERSTGDVVILDLTGRVAAGAAALEVGDAVRRVLVRGYRKVLLNLDRTRSSDAAGISAFLGALLDAQALGADVRLFNVARRITSLCLIMALYRYFSVFDTEDDALDSFLARRGSNATVRRLAPAA